MIGIELIQKDLPALKHTDTGDLALHYMDELKISHLAVLKNKNFVGLVSENDLLDKADLSLELTKLFDHLPRPFVLGASHIYDVLKLATHDHLSLVPVLDEKENYLGSISVNELMFKFAQSESICEEGGILILQMNELDYSLAQIAQIIESENARILSSFILTNQASKEMELTLKINRYDLGGIIQALNRYDYTVKASFQRNSFDDNLKDRYDELMKYLNI